MSFSAAVRHNRATKDATNEEMKAIIKDHLRYADKRLQRLNKKTATPEVAADISDDDGTLAMGRNEDGSSAEEP